MSRHLRTRVGGAIILAALAAAPALYAQDYLRTPQGSMMGQGMMGSLMSGMMDMMGMSGDMGGMAERCSGMMQALDDGHAHRPNDQWRSPQPQQPGQPRG